MSVIDFTQNSCKTNEIINRQITENFEEHFAMYTLSNIKNISNIEVSRNENTYIIKANNKECDEIIRILSPYKCSNFKNTLTPIFEKIEDGLKIEFITNDGE